MVYQVAALDDAVAVDADNLISLTPLAIAMMAQAPASDARPPREAPYAVFVRDVKIGGLMAPALWDLGCSRSVIPYSLAMQLPNPVIDLTETYNLMTAGGLSSTIGTIRADLYLTPTAYTLATVIRREGGVRNAPRYFSAT